MPGKKNWELVKAETVKVEISIEAYEIIKNWADLNGTNGEIDSGIFYMDSLIMKVARAVKKSSKGKVL